MCVVAAVRVEMEVSKRKARADSPAPQRESGCRLPPHTLPGTSTRSEQLATPQ